MIDFIKYWSDHTDIAVGHFIQWLEISSSKYYNWRDRYGRVNEHNALVPRDFWLEEWEKQAIIKFHLEYPLEGYRRLTFMMLMPLDNKKPAFLIRKRVYLLHRTLPDYFMG